jgi:hypothetical protein
MASAVTSGDTTGGGVGVLVGGSLPDCPPPDNGAFVVVSTCVGIAVSVGVAGPDGVMIADGSISGSASQSPWLSTSSAMIQKRSASPIGGAGQISRHQSVPSVAMN